MLEKLFIQRPEETREIFLKIYNLAASVGKLLAQRYGYIGIEKLYRMGRGKQKQIFSPRNQYRFNGQVEYL